MKLFKGLFLSTIIFCFSFYQTVLPRGSKKQSSSGSDVSSKPNTAAMVLIVVVGTLVVGGLAVGTFASNISRAFRNFKKSSSSVLKKLGIQAEPTVEVKLLDLGKGLQVVSLIGDQKSINLAYDQLTNLKKLKSTDLESIIGAVDPDKLRKFINDAVLEKVLDPLFAKAGLTDIPFWGRFKIDKAGINGGDDIWTIAKDVAAEMLQAKIGEPNTVIFKQLELGPDSIAFNLSKPAEGVSAYDFLKLKIKLSQFGIDGALPPKIDINSIDDPVGKIKSMYGKIGRSSGGVTSVRIDTDEKMVEVTFKNSGWAEQQGFKEVNSKGEKNPNWVNLEGGEVRVTIPEAEVVNRLIETGRTNIWNSKIISSKGLSALGYSADSLSALETYQNVTGYKLSQIDNLIKAGLKVGDEFKISFKKDGKIWLPGDNLLDLTSTLTYKATENGLERQSGLDDEDAINLNEQLSENTTYDSFSNDFLGYSYSIPEPARGG